MPPVNRKTALCHTVRRNMGGSPSGDATVRAREDIPTHRPSRKENVSPLIGHDSGWNPSRCLRSASKAMVAVESRTNYPGQLQSRFDSGHVHSEDCGFPFALTFEGGAPQCCPNTHCRASSDNDGTARLSLGEVSGFSALFFVLVAFVIRVLFQ